MSLINDMLRDLDARRLDLAPNSPGVGKLTPVNDQSRNNASASRNKILLIAGIALLLVVAAVMYYTNSLNQTRVVTVNTPEPETATQSVLAIEEDTLRMIAESDAARLVADEELRSINARMQLLEEQNRKLQEQTRLAAFLAASNNTASNELSANRSATGSEENRLFEQQQQDLSPQSPGTLSPNDSVQTQQTLDLASAQVIQPLVRSPRDLSFADTDRLAVQEALELWRDNQRNTALQKLNLFAAENPGAHQSRETLAKLLLQQGDTDSALQIVESGLRIAPNNAGYKKIKARLLMGDSQPLEAIAVLEQSAPTVTVDPEYHDLLAASRLAGERYDDALLSYQALTAHDAEQARWWYGLAASQDAKGRVTEATKAYERALQLGNLSLGLREASQQRLNLIRQE